MNSGVYPLAASMINQLNRVDALSNNLANSNTTAFKQDNLTEGSFNYYLERAAKEKTPVSTISTITNTIPKIDSNFVDKNMGAIVPTNNKLDFAIKENNMFFKVQNPQTKEILLTRDGAFNIVNDMLVTKNGFNVLNNDNGLIATEGNFETQISLVKSEFTNLEKQGNNNYRISQARLTTILPENEEFMLQGALEKSNVNSITTMVGLIDSHRRFEQASKAMTGIDDINKKLIEKIGRAV